MSMRTIASCVSNMNSASARASSVLPTPVGPRNRNEPIGRSGSDSPARELLGDLGYDPVYGALPLKRVIQKRLVDRLALAMLQGEFADGDVVVVDASSDGELTFSSQRPVTAT
jgi:hypothetical protein